MIAVLQEDLSSVVLKDVSKILKEKSRVSPVDVPVIRSEGNLHNLNLLGLAVLHNHGRKRTSNGQDSARSSRQERAFDESPFRENCSKGA